MHKDKDDGGACTDLEISPPSTHSSRRRNVLAGNNNNTKGESVVKLDRFKALNGFLMILTCEGEVFFATHSIEGYLGFHQVINSKRIVNFDHLSTATSKSIRFE
jgi:hypothetical protein